MCLQFFWVVIICIYKEFFLFSSKEYILFKQSKINMSIKSKTIIRFIFLISLSLSSCSPGQTFGPTSTPSPTITVTVIPTQTDIPTEVTSTPAATATAEATATTAIEYPPTVHALTSDDLTEKGIAGTGFEIIDKFQGVIPLDITVVISKTIQDQYGRVRQCILNPNMAKLDPTRSAEERAEETALLGFYMAYVRDHGYTENSYTFDKYLSDLSAGKDMSVQMYGEKLDGTIGTFKTKPGVIEFIGIAPGSGSYGDPVLTNSRAYLLNDFGYQELKDGGMRIVNTIPEEDADLAFCSELNIEYEGSFGKMGWSIKDLKGDYPMYGGPTDTFPKTVDRLNNTVGDNEVWAKYGISGAIFIQP
jgi:hypothetical protein